MNKTQIRRFLKVAENLDKYLDMIFEDDDLEEWLVLEKQCLPATTQGTLLDLRFALKEKLGN